jgi:hypothetical protein
MTYNSMYTWKGNWEAPYLPAGYTNRCSFFNNSSLNHHSHHNRVTRVEDELQGMKYQGTDEKGKSSNEPTLQ